MSSSAESAIEITIECEYVLWWCLGCGSHHVGDEEREPCPSCHSDQTIRVYRVSGPVDEQTFDSA